MNEYKPILTKLELMALIVWIILTIVVIHVEAQESSTVIAIDCGDGWTDVEGVASPEIIEYFELVNLRVWRLPANSKHADGLTRPAYTLRFEDGSEMLVTLSGTLTVEYNAVSKGLWWRGGQPDWRRIGDGNPHPDRLYLLNADEAEAILEHC